MTAKLENLPELIGGYFHQDWDIEGDNEEEVLESFFKNTGKNITENVIKEIDEVLISSKNDKANIDELLDSLHCDYNYKYFDITGEEWLSRIRDILQKILHSG